MNSCIFWNRQQVMRQRVIQYLKYQKRRGKSLIYMDLYKQVYLIIAPVKSIPLLVFPQRLSKKQLIMQMHMCMLEKGLRTQSNRYLSTSETASRTLNYNVTPINLENKCIVNKTLFRCQETCKINDTNLTCIPTLFIMKQVSR